MLDYPTEQDRGADPRRVMAWTAIDRPQFAVDDEGTIRTIAVSGELDLAFAGELAALSHHAVTQCRDVVIDLSRADFIDSSGVHVLLRTHQQARERSVGLSIVPASEPVQRVFEVCGATAILPFAGGAPPASRRGSSTVHA